MSKKIFNKKTKLITLSAAILSASLSFSLIPAFTSNNSDLKSLNQTVTNSASQNISTKASNFDYTPIANNVNSQPISTSVGFIGVNSASNKLYLTSYEGVTVWQTDILNNSMIKTYYSQKLSVNDISSYTIKSWKYIESMNVIALVFSATDGTKATVFGVKADTGLIYTPALDNSGNPKLTNMVQVADGTDVLWLNSSNEIIASKFGNYNVYSQNTWKIVFSKTGVERFNPSIRNVAVDVDNAQAKVTSKIGTTDSLNGIDFEFRQPGSEDGNAYNWDKGNGTRWQLQALIEGKAGSGRNIAIFTDAERFTDMYLPMAGYQYYQKLYLQQAVLVDDNLDPVIINNKKVAFTLNNFVCYQDGTNTDHIWLSASNLPKYGYIGKSNGTNQNFIWLTSGIYNSVTQLTYNESTQSITASIAYDMQRQNDQDVITWSYDVTENRLFTSNSWTSSNISIGYFDFDDTNLTYKSLVDAGFGGTTSGTITNYLYFSPVKSTGSIKETPLVYYNRQDNSKVTGLYFENGTTAKTVNLARKTYNDIQTSAEKLSWHKQKAASSITNQEALQALTYNETPLNGSFTNTISTLTGNDDNGTLRVVYNTSYQNWWNTSTKSSFDIERTITGMYAKNGSSFNFVTTMTGDTGNDNKYNLQLSYKSNKYPSSIVWTDVETYFTMPNIKDINGNVIKLTSDMITLTPNDQEGTLKIKVDYSSKLPTGLPNDYLVYEQEFSGFNNLAGYEKDFMSDDQQSASGYVKNIKATKYPSELTVEDLVGTSANPNSNFFNKLGTSYSRNKNDWELSNSYDDYAGTTTITLKYKSSTLPNDFPEEYKNVVTTIKLTGFKKVTDAFRNVTWSNYSGIKTADEIWTEYQTGVTNNTTLSTALSKLISVPYVSFDKLSITKESTSTDNRLDLTVKVKEGSTSSLVVNKGLFTFDSSTEANFIANGLSYPYKLSINVSTVDQSIEYVTPDNSFVDITNNKNETISIDLTKAEYKSINSTMYADDVTKSDIRELFKSSGFVVTDSNIEIFSNNQDGILYATVRFVSGGDTTTQDSNTTTFSLQSASRSTREGASIPEGSVITKRFEITGFKTPISPVVIAIPSAVAGVIVIAIIAYLVYLKVIRKNLNKFVANKQDPRYVSSLDKKAQAKQIKKFEKSRKEMMKKLNKKD